MDVLVDSTVWSLALRRRRGSLSGKESALVQGLAELVRAGRARIFGTIRQELLTGIKDPPGFERLRESLRQFHDEPLTTDDYERAAEISNTCRKVGITTSATDCLISAVADKRGWAILTQDQDFVHIRRAFPLVLNQEL